MIDDRDFAHVVAPDDVDQLAARPFTDVERARLWQHVMFVEDCHHVALSLLLIPRWAVALGCAFVGVFVVLVTDERTDVRSLAAASINALAIATCGPALAAGRPLPIPASLVDDPTARARRRQQWSMFVGVWIALATQVVVLVARFVS